MQIIRRTKQSMAIGGFGMGGTWTVSGRDIVLAAAATSGPSMAGRVEWAPDKQFVYPGDCQPGGRIGVMCVQMRVSVTGGPNDGRTLSYRFYPGG